MRVGVIGAGTMGAGIAHAFTVAGHTVTVAEVDEAQRAAALKRVEDVLSGGVERGRLTGSQREAALDLLSFVGSVDELDEDLDLLVEAVPEILVP